MEQFSLESARAAARCARTAIWVGEFLCRAWVLVFFDNGARDTFLRTRAAS
jgi:hypothetical protein